MSAPARVSPPTDSSLELVLVAFERQLRLQGKSENTIRIYNYHLASLVRFMRAHETNDLARLDRELLEQWQLQLLERGAAGNTRSSASTAARALIRFAAERDIVDWRLERAVVAVKVKKRKRRPIPREDLMKILRFIVPRRPRMSIVELRDRALFVYLLVSGARVTEVLQAKRDDYIAPIVIQKGGTEKTLHTSPTLVDLVVDYLRGRRDDSPWLFITHGNNINAMGDRMTPDAVREAMHRLSEQLLITRFTTHQLRHTTATYLGNSGISGPAGAAWLGHANLETFMDYFELEEPMVQVITAKLEQLIKPPPRPLPRATRSWSDYVR